MKDKYLDHAIRGCFNNQAVNTKTLGFMNGKSSALKSTQFLLKRVVLTIGYPIIWGEAIMGDGQALDN